MEIINTSYAHLVLKKISEAGESFFIFDLSKNKFTHANQSFLNIINSEITALNADPFSLLLKIHEDDRDHVVNSLSDFLIDSNRKTIEFRTKSDPVKFLSTTVFLVSENHSRLVAGFVKDISIDKDYIHNIIKMLCIKNATLEILAHDLAGPLSMIKMMSEMIRKEHEEKKFLPENDFAEMIVKASERSLNLIKEFVNQEFLESAEIQVKKDRIDIVNRVNTILETYKKSEGYISKKFKVECLTDKFYMNIDDMKFLQAINNLISNAIKFTRDNGNITVRLEDKENNVLITIEDDGIGIPEKYHSVLFEKFTRARRPGIRGEQTVGLGMSLIKKVVDLHEGKIWFESEVNKGTKFFIMLPA